DLPQSGNYETIGGLMMYMLRKIPKRTDFVKFSGYAFEVVDIDSYRIDQLLVTGIDERPPVLNVNKNTVDESESTQDRN
ncbi:transporter associated domain-containing protein, partial [Pantoea sp. GbtcB22]|uniref:transporter associated domain-containing protein n=1 Tax=Pantoea sp. GbtcB22 TaxID=2824767 RepID=UPI0027388704